VARRSGEAQASALITALNQATINQCRDIFEVEAEGLQGWTNY